MFSDHIKKVEKEGKLGDLCGTGTSRGLLNEKFRMGYRDNGSHLEKFYCNGQKVIIGTIGLTIEL